MHGILQENLANTGSTNDDIQIILVSGCTVALTLNKSDFIDGTYQHQKHNIKEIGAGLTKKGSALFNGLLKTIQVNTLLSN